MGILDEALQSVTKSMILKSIKLDRIDTQHIVKQKMGNNPIEKFADDNIYDICAVKNIDKLIIGGYGEKSEVGLGAMRDIDYASYVTKMAVAIKDIPLVRTNGPFSNITSELLMFLNIWKKYYGTRVDHHRISGKEEATNPLTIISAMIYKNDKNIRLEMLIANSKLVETNAGELKYFGDLILFATERLGYGKTYTQPEKYSENSELRTTLSALTGKSEYGQKLLRAVEQSFENLDFIRKDLEAIQPNISIIHHMLWVSNIYKQK